MEEKKMERKTATWVMISVIFASIFLQVISTTKANGTIIVPEDYLIDQKNEYDFSTDNNRTELVIGVNERLPSDEELMSFVSKSNGSIVNTVSVRGTIQALIIDLPSNTLDEFAKEAKSVDFIDYTEPNMKFQIDFAPNDFYWAKQWGPQKIEADWAWNTTTGKSSLLVAVVDSGIDYTHPDLVTNYVPLGYDWVDKDNDPIDNYGHGTHIAGIIAATINNSIGIAGLAQVRIMAERGLDNDGHGYEDDLANAIIHAVDEGANIINLSWGGDESMLIHDAIEYAYANDVLVIASAGNDGTSNKHYPAAHEEVVAVTATDATDKPAFFTSFGDWVEVAAPGVNILSTMWSGSYKNMSGTSMAAPHVSGAAALIWSRSPNMTRDQLIKQLLYTSDDLGDQGFDEYYGYGRINIRRAIETPPEHELILTKQSTVSYMKPNSKGKVSNTVFNFGRQDEINLTINLMINGTVVNSTEISLASGSSIEVSLSWIPIDERTYNVTSYVVPVQGELNTINNALSADVLVRIGDTIRVPEDYLQIEDAVEAAKPLDTILVACGTYSGNFCVDKTLTLLGEDPKITIVDGSLGVYADNVIINGFTLRYGHYDYYNAGIEVWRSNSVNISSNIVTNCGIGICLTNADKSFIANNTIIYNWRGIMLYDSNDNSIINNNALNNTGYGMYILSSSRNTFVNNTVNSNFGFYIKQSSYNTLRNNNINSNEANFGVHGYSKSQYVHSIDTSNTINGRPIYYWVSEQDRKIPADASFVGLVDCLNITVQNLNLTDNTRGILLAYTSNSTIQNNTLINNWWGITCNKCSNNTIRNNIATYSSVAFVLYSSSNNILRNNSAVENFGGVYEFYSANIIDNNLISSNEAYGIFLCSSSNNVVRNNNVTETERYGIHLEDSNNNTIDNNNVTETYYPYGFGYGIYLETSNNNTISNNKMKNNRLGLYIYDSQRNLLTGNKLIESLDINIRLQNSSQNKLRNNSMTSKYCANFGVEGSLLQHFVQDIDISNTVDGKAVYYLINQNGITVNPSTYPNIGYLAVINSTNITVRHINMKMNRQGVLFVYTNNSKIENATAAGNYIGIQLIRSSNNSITGNNITSKYVESNYIGIQLIRSSNNSITGNNITKNWYGILFEEFSDNNTIIKNTIERNHPGIFLAFCNHNTISNNYLLNNIEGMYLYRSDYNKITDNHLFCTYEYSYGIGLRDSNRNLIYRNNFINYQDAAHTLKSYNNIWDAGYPCGGNYWIDYNGTDQYSGPYQNETGSDGIGDIPYIIDENNQDNYPLMKPYADLHDIGITSINTSKTIVGQNYSININVKIINYGEEKENFNLSIKVNSTTIQTQTVILTARNSTTITFMWNTAGFAKGNYTISAYAKLVSEETDITDNMLINGWVSVTIPGDVDGDRDIDIYDVVKITGVYWSKIGGPTYNPNSDINGDDVIDMDDIIICINKYGYKET
jgi:thermitase